MTTIKTDILNTALAEIGLTDLEITVYTILLRSPGPNYSQVGRDLGVDRRKIASSVEKIVEFGLARYINGTLELENPAVISAILTHRENKSQLIKKNLAGIMPEIMSGFYTTNKNLIKLYEGKTQFIQLFNEILEEPGLQEVCTVGNSDNFFEFVNFEYFELWKQKRINMRILSRDIVFSNQFYNQLKPNNQLELRQTKFLDKKYQFDGLYSISPRAFICWNPILPKAILITDPITIKMFQSIFEIMWDTVETC